MFFKLRVIGKLEMLIDCHKCSILRIKVFRRSLGCAESRVEIAGFFVCPQCGSDHHCMGRTQRWAPCLREGTIFWIYLSV